MEAGTLKIHQIHGYICNIYLLEYDHGLLLFDCGSYNDVKRIEQYCDTRLHRSPRDIKLAVVSHMHPDHSGGAGALRKKYGIPVAAHQEVDFWYAGLGGCVQHKLDCSMEQFVAWRTRHKLEKVLFNRIIHPDLILREGDPLPGFADWKVLHVPGHTLHDIALYNPDQKILYPGDCLLNVHGRMMPPLPVMFPDKMARSYEKMAALPADHILTAHGDPFACQDYPDVFESLIRRVKSPPSAMVRRIHRLSVYSHEIWKEWRQSGRRA